MIKPSAMLEFKEALSGGHGDFDAWLEVRDEAECREFIKQAIRDALEEAAKVVLETKEWKNGKWTSTICPTTQEAIAAAIRKLKEDIQ